MFGRIKNMIGDVKFYGNCPKCGDSWYWKQPHFIQYTEAQAAFPLCKECWDKVDTKERLFYVDMLVNGWLQQSPLYRDEILEKYELIKKAVTK